MLHTYVRGFLGVNSCLAPIEVWHNHSVVFLLADVLSMLNDLWSDTWSALVYSRHGARLDLTIDGGTYWKLSEGIRRLTPPFLQGTDISQCWCGCSSPEYEPMPMS